MTFRSDHVPSCWPPHFAVAPVTDYSVLDTWLSLLRTDCSALRIVRPVLRPDLTRLASLSALRRLRITPLPTHYARAVHGSPRATDCSVVQHLELCTACGLLRTRYLALLAALRLLLIRHLTLHAAPGLLRARRLALRAGLRIAPYADTWCPCDVRGLLRSCHLSSAPSQITLCPTLDALL